jgi:hypothetical protein
MFRADVDNKSKFTLIFHPQQAKDKQQPGILVDIFSLTNRCFLSIGVQNLVANQPQKRFLVSAKSPTAPSNKFLILAGDVA